ncbi:MAG: DUF1330 domain-containing protein [Pseudoruegeria sp.]
MIYATVYMTVKNPDAMIAYREHAGIALAKYGGKVEAANPEPTVIDDGLAVPSLAAILSFPDKDSAMGWINDPDHADLHTLRRSVGTSSIFLLG